MTTDSYPRRDLSLCCLLMCICFDNVYFRITQCDIYICFNDFDILYIVYYNII